MCECQRSFCKHYRDICGSAGAVVKIAEMTGEVMAHFRAHMTLFVIKDGENVEAPLFLIDNSLVITY